MSVREATLKAWAWATFMADGCVPRQCEDSIALAQIEGFAIGRMGTKKWSEMRASVPRHRFDLPYPDDFAPPDRFSWTDLLRVVRANDPST